MNHKTDMQAVLLDAMRVISESADEIKAGCAIDDEWPDAEDKAEYDRHVAVLERVRALAGQSAGVAEASVELSGVKEAIENGGGFWRSCWGCYETNEGVETGHYPYSKIMQCCLGSGCSECGGIGAVWDDTDYAAMGDAMMASTNSAAPAPVSAPAPDREQATLCEDGGKCGIGGYCGQCEKLRAASEPEQPKQSVPAPLSEYHEDTGPVVWWTWQDGLWLGEPAWIGAPTDSDWPGYHTHWTYHPEFPLPPLAVAAKLNEAPRRVTCSLTHEQISALYLHLLRRPRPEFGWMEAPLVAIESALMPVHGAIHDRGFNAMNRQFFGDDRFKFEERNIPPNIEPAEQPSERVEQECPHGVDDDACKQCYGEATRSTPTPSR